MGRNSSRNLEGKYPVNIRAPCRVLNPTNGTISNKLSYKFNGTLNTVCSRLTVYVCTKLISDWDLREKNVVRNENVC